MKKTHKLAWIVSAFMVVLTVGLVGCSDDQTSPAAPGGYSAVAPSPVTAYETATDLYKSGEWGYAEHNGPEHWGELGYSICGGGMSQSPIDIPAPVGGNTGDWSNCDRIRFNYNGDVDLSVVHNGHSVQANLQEIRSIEVDGVASTLSQFHFHTQSEHTVNGRHSPMEMHLVHTADDGTITVIGVFIEIGKWNKELDKIWRDLPTEEDDMLDVTSFKLKKLLPHGGKSTFRYTGSLTTPSCDESVNWIVFKNPITMSEQQIDQFVDIFSGEEFPNGNRRPTQPLNGRTVTMCK